MRYLGKAYKAKQTQGVGGEKTIWSNLLEVQHFLKKVVFFMFHLYKARPREM